MRFSTKKKLNLDLSDNELEKANYETKSKFSLIKQLTASSSSCKSKFSHIECQYESAIAETNLHLKTVDHKIALERKKINQMIQNAKWDKKDNGRGIQRSWETSEVYNQSKNYLKGYLSPGHGDAEPFEFFNGSPKNTKTMKEESKKKLFYNFDKLYTIDAWRTENLPKLESKNSNPQKRIPVREFEKKITSIMLKLNDPVVKNPKDILQSLLISSSMPTYLISSEQNERERENVKILETLVHEAKDIAVPINIIDGEGGSKSINYMFSPDKVQKKIIAKYSNRILNSSHQNSKNLIKRIVHEYSKSLDKLYNNVTKVKVPKYFSVWMQDYNDFYHYREDGNGNNFPDYLIETQLKNYLDKKLNKEVEKVTSNIPKYSSQNEVEDEERILSDAEDENQYGETNSSYNSFDEENFEFKNEEDNLERRKRREERRREREQRRRMRNSEKLEDGYEEEEEEEVERNENESAESKEDEDVQDGNEGIDFHGTKKFNQDIKKTFSEDNQFKDEKETTFSVQEQNSVRQHSKYHKQKILEKKSQVKDSIKAPRPEKTNRNKIDNKSEEMRQKNVTNVNTNDTNQVNLDQRGEKRETIINKEANQFPDKKKSKNKKHQNDKINPENVRRNQYSSVESLEKEANSHLSPSTSKKAKSPINQSNKFGTMKDDPKMNTKGPNLNGNNSISNPVSKKGLKTNSQERLKIKSEVNSSYEEVKKTQNNQVVGIDKSKQTKTVRFKKDSQGKEPDILNEDGEQLRNKEKNLSKDTSTQSKSKEERNLTGSPNQQVKDSKEILNGTHPQSSPRSPQNQNILSGISNRVAFNTPVGEIDQSQTEAQNNISNSNVRILLEDDRSIFSQKDKSIIQSYNNNQNGKFFNEDEQINQDYIGANEGRNMESQGFDLEKYIHEALTPKGEKKSAHLIDMLLAAPSVLENDIKLKDRAIESIRIPKNLKFESNEYEKLFQKLYVWHTDLKNDLQDLSERDNLSEFEDSEVSHEEESKEDNQLEEFSNDKERKKKENN